MASDYTSKFSEKYGQLSGADLEILGAREQAATARALRTAFKPAQGQMVGGWYVKPALTQNLADALMQYNNYKNEQAGTTEAKRLITARQTLSDEADKYGATRDVPVRPGYQVSVPAIESGTTNSLVDEALAGGYGTNEQGQPLFNAAPTTSATPSAIPNDGAQAYIPPTAEAQGNVNANPTNNQYMGDPLANAVRNAPLEGAVAGANNQSAIPPVVGGQNIPQGGQASADGMLPAITVTPEPEPNRLAQMLRGEGEYAPIQKASVTDVPAVPSNFDQRVYARMLSKASRDAEAANEWKDIETQSTNEQHRLSNIATIAGRNADNIATNYRFAVIAANQLANKKDTDKAIADAKAEAHTADIENKQWQTNENNKTRVEVARIGADVRKDVLTQGKLGPGQRFKEGTNEVELIPGTTQYLKAKNDHATDIAARDTIVGINQHVTKSIDKLLNSNGFDKIFGLIGGNTFNWSDDAKAAATARNQVVGALEAAGLAINKQANGSIGAMAVAEWPKMATYIAVIKNSDNPKDVKDALVGAKEVLDRTASIATGKYTNEYGGGQFDTSRKASSAPSGGVKKYNLDTGKIE